MALILLLESGMMGVFCSLDFFLFYVFWEVMLLPMYFLIGIWGGPRKEYAAIKFFLYTLAGSVLMLLAMIAIYLTSGPTTLVDGTACEHTFNLVKLADSAGGTPLTELAFFPALHQCCPQLGALLVDARREVCARSQVAEPHPPHVIVRYLEPLLTGYFIGLSAGI